jgi:hypothetical protein
MYVGVGWSVCVSHNITTARRTLPTHKKASQAEIRNPRPDVICRCSCIIIGRTLLYRYCCCVIVIVCVDSLRQ